MKRFLLGFGLLALLTPLTLMAAKTTTWRGGAEGSFTEPGNWDNGAPESGDTAVFTGNSAVKITGSFSIATGGALTVDNACEVDSHVAFSGAGKFVKKGAGMFKTFVWTDHSGGSRIENGMLKIGNDFKAPWNDSQQFGSGEIELVRYSDSAPTLSYKGFGGKYLLNAIRITGAITSGTGAIECGFPNQYIDSKITADSDFLINNSGATGGCVFRGDIEAPGHVVNVFALVGGNNDPKCVRFAGKVNASIKKVTTSSTYTWEGSENIELTGVSSGLDNALIVDWRKSILLSSSASWAGTNLVVNGANAAAKGFSDTCLSLNGSGNLSPIATVNLLNGGKLDIASGVTCSVSALVIDGNPQDEGTYTKENLPNSITGEGALVVARRKLWLGGAEGDLAAAKNWSDGAAPGAGDYLVFTGTDAVKLTGELEIGEGELVIDNACLIENYVAFSGAGKIVKKGAGDFNVHVFSTHAGGTRVENAVLKVTNDFADSSDQNRTAFGSGEIELVRYSDSRPCIMNTAMNKSLVNDIKVTGSIASGNGAIYASSYLCLFGGKITADSDILVTTAWGGVKFTGDVNAHGHVVSCYVGCDDGGWGGMIFTGAVDANLKKITTVNPPDWQGQRPVVLEGVSTNPDCTLDVEWSSSISLSAACEWSGTNIVVDGATAARASGGDETARLKLQAGNNLSDAAVIRTLNGGLVEIASGVRVKVAALYVDGVRQPCGTYTAAKLPKTIAGEGRLTVGRPGLFLVVK